MNNSEAMEIIEKFISCNDYNDCSLKCEGCNYDYSCNDLVEACRFIVNHGKEESEG